MAQQKLDLLQLSSVDVAQLCASSSQVMGSEMFKVKAFGTVPDDIPDNILRYACAPRCPVSTHRPKRFSYVTLEQRVPQNHPLREKRRLTDVVLASLSGAFDEMYSAFGRPSIAPEYVLRALLLQAFYSVRSEPQLVEQLDYNLLFRWFVGLGMDDAVWSHAVFSKNRHRLITSEVAQQFCAEVNKQAKRFMSDEHFTVDGTLIQAWASQKSFRKKDSCDRDGTNFHGQQRTNETHESTTDPDARLY